MWKWLNQKLSPRQIAFLLAAAVLAVIHVITSLNIENWAQKHGLDRFLLDAEGPIIEFIEPIFKFLLSDIVLGIVIGGLMASLLPQFRLMFARLRTKNLGRHQVFLDIKNAPDDIMALLLDMAELSHNLLIQYYTGDLRKFDENHIRRLISKVQISAKHVYFDEYKKLYLTAYIINCEQHLYLAIMREAIQKKTGNWPQWGIKEPMKFIEDAPANLARMCGIYINRVTSEASRGPKQSNIE